jgi:hypothetical protein
VGVSKPRIEATGTAVSIRGFAATQPAMRRYSTSDALLVELLLLAPADAGGNKAVEVAIEDGARVVHLKLGAQVFDHLVWRKNV